MDLLAALTVSCLDLLAVVDGVSCLDLDLGVLLLTSLDLADGFSVSTDLPVLLLDGAADLLLVVSSAFPADFEVPSFKLSLPLDFCPDLAVASFDLLLGEASISCFSDGSAFLGFSSYDFPKLLHQHWLLAPLLTYYHLQQVPSVPSRDSIFCLSISIVNCELLPGRIIIANCPFIK